MDMLWGAGDVIYTNSPIEPPSSPLPDLQHFWEAFPSGSGPRDRTTYMFTYIDALPCRPSLLAMMEQYWHLMPKYQVSPHVSTLCRLQPLLAMETLPQEAQGFGYPSLSVKASHKPSVLRLYGSWSSVLSSDSLQHQGT